MAVETWNTQVQKVGVSNRIMTLRDLREFIQAAKDIGMTGDALLSDVIELKIEQEIPIVGGTPVVTTTP